MTDILLSCWIPGRPRPQGALKTFAVAGKAYGRHTDSTLSHRAHVISTLAAEWGREPLTGAVSVDVVFTFARPKSHYGTGRNADVVKESAPEHHIQRVDGDKLARLVGDSLEMAGILHDDCLVVEWHINKNWGDSDWTHITLREIS